MSTSRAFTFVVAGFMAAAISFDPRASSPSAPHPVAASDATAHAAPPSVEATGPAPEDVEVEITPDGRSAHRVVVRRRGFLVSLRNEDARSAGEDWTALRISPREGAVGVTGRLIWETTRLDGKDGLATERGLVRLTGDGTGLSGTLLSAAPPVPATSWKSPRATCSGLHDGLGGFTVLCHFAKGVRVSGVANVTRARSLDDTWLVPGSPSPLVRLDLPRSPGGADARIAGMVQGATGAVLRAEASFFEGEEATLLVQESERAQPVL
jgi:hypothetical protein